MRTLAAVPSQSSASGTGPDTTGSCCLYWLTCGSWLWASRCRSQLSALKNGSMNSRHTPRFVVLVEAIDVAIAFKSLNQLEDFLRSGYFYPTFWFSSPL